MLDIPHLAWVSWASQTYGLISNSKLSNFRLPSIQIFLLLMSFFTLYHYYVFIPSLTDVSQFWDGLF